MAYLDTIDGKVTGGVAGRIDNGDLNAALMFPLWEQIAPQYPQPHPYQLAEVGYRKNELAYRCINRWAGAVSEAPLAIYERTPGTDKMIENHGVRELLENPNARMGETEFWRATEIYLKIAGFAAWEIETNRLNEPIGLHPLRPDWCAFHRGDRNPLAWIRYQPYGLDPFYIPAERVLLFQYFDPIFPLLKALAPSAVGARVMSTDNNATDFLKVFFERGAVVNGLLSTEQQLQDEIAEDIRLRWRERHGGVGNWGDVAVLGNGVKYQQMQMDFRSMTFDAIDGREEARICQVFDMEPILVGAKIGLDRATYSNYESAKSAWYDGSVRNEWTFLASTVDRQLLPYFEANRQKRYCGFDLQNVIALQEDADARHTRAREDAKLNLITRDEAREMMGLNPIDNAPVWIGPGASGATEPDTAQADQLVRNATANEPEPETETDTTSETDDAENDARDAAKALERKQYRAHARKGNRKPFVFRYLDAHEQAELKKKFAGVKAVAYGSDAHRAILETFDARTAPHEAKLKKLVTKHFKAQERVLLDTLNTKSVKADKSGDAQPAVFDLRKYLADVMNVDAETELTDEYQKLLEAVVLEIGQEAAKDAGGVGIAFDLDDPRAVKFIQQRAQRFAQQIDQTTYTRLQAELSAAMEAGESIPQMAARVQSVMGDRIRSSAETIARTEIISASNFSTVEGWRQSGVVSTKTWLATLDDRVRDWHREAHGQTVGLDEPFIVDGEELMYPGDANGSAENVINCRCAMTAGIA